MSVRTLALLAFGDPTDIMGITCFHGELLTLMHDGRIQGKPQINDKGFVDTGCSRILDWEHRLSLSDFKEFDGRLCFILGGGITWSVEISKYGFLKTDCLDFEDLPDESQILLKIPRKENIYSFDMKNIVPKENLTCLVAKATLDESMLWHRRIGHINFKNINKLVKDNLVRGLPIKHFENDQTCVACLKGKQCRASLKYKSFDPQFTIAFVLCFIWICLVQPLEKGIKREYSVARTPQQNGVAERRNRTLIEAARTIGFKLALSFMRPFGCHVTILNTLDNLGKFDGKSDEGFFVGYSLSSKAFRVYNTRTRKVEENLHVGFLENKPMIEGNGPKWLFDIDSLTQSMNYVPVAAGTISNESIGKQGELNAYTSTQKEQVSQGCIVMPIWKDTTYFDSPLKDVNNDEPKPAIDDKREVEDGSNDKNDDKDKSEDDSSLKEDNTAEQQVNTASPRLNT
ncbi:ribonuclease H-like domain-containing protein, partial [Tanacetum coccineum]